MAGKSANVKDNVKVVAKPLGQIEINMIEERLTLNHGTLPQEMGAVLANKHGRALKMSKDATTELSYIDKITDIDKRKAKTVEIRKNLETAKRLRKEEVAAYTKLAMDYITKEYGAETRDSNKRLIGYGDAIEVLKTRHIRKVW